MPIDTNFIKSHLFPAGADTIATGGKELLKDYLHYRRVVTGLGGGMMGAMINKDDSTAATTAGLVGGLGGSIAAGIASKHLPLIMKTPAAMLTPILSGYAASKLTSLAGRPSTEQ